MLTRLLCILVRSDGPLAFNSPIHEVVLDDVASEPLLNSHLFEMIQLAHERHMKVHITTNGTLLPGSVDAFLKAPVEYLSISLYGTDAKHFAQLTSAKGSLFDDMTIAVPS